jgi:hypothetical protein
MLMTLQVKLLHLGTPKRMFTKEYALRMAWDPTNIAMSHQLSRGC